MSFLRALQRALYFVFCSTKALSIIIAHRLWKGPNLDHALHIRRLCLRRLLPALGVELQLHGTLPNDQKGPCLLVGNHRSYLDPIIVLADIKALPVSKAEVAHWPLIGFAAKQTGILFVKREKESSRKKTLQAIKNMLQKGYSILLFPEGTTSAVGSKTLPFKPGAFRLATELNIPIIPFAIEYDYPQDAWIGDDTFVPHFFRCFGKKTTPIQIQYGPALSGTNHQELREKARHWIDTRLQEWK